MISFKVTTHCVKTHNILLRWFYENNFILTVSWGSINEDVSKMFMSFIEAVLLILFSEKLYQNDWLKFKYLQGIFFQLLTYFEQNKKVFSKAIEFNDYDEVHS